MSDRNANRATHVRRDRQVSARLLAMRDGTALYRASYDEKGDTITRLTACSDTRFLREFQALGK